MQVSVGRKNYVFMVNYNKSRFRKAVGRAGLPRRVPVGENVLLDSLPVVGAVLFAAHDVCGGWSIVASEGTGDKRGEGGLVFGTRRHVYIEGWGAENLAAILWGVASVMILMRGCSTPACVSSCRIH